MPDRAVPVSRLSLRSDFGILTGFSIDSVGGCWFYSAASAEKVALWRPVDCLSRGCRHYGQDVDEMGQPVRRHAGEPLGPQNRLPVSEPCGRSRRFIRRWSRIRAVPASRSFEKMSANGYSEPQADIQVSAPKPPHGNAASTRAQVSTSNLPESRRLPEGTIGLKPGLFGEIG